MAKNDNRFDDSQRLVINGEFCIYCGEIAVSREHFPPASVTRHGLILPACSECNSFAGTECSFDFDDRCSYVKNMIRIRYRSFIRNPSWNKDEIDELGYNLKVGTIEWQKIKAVVLKRIAWNAVSYLSSIDRNNYFAEFYVKIDTITKLEKSKSKSTEVKWSKPEETKVSAPIVTKMVELPIELSINKAEKWIKCYKNGKGYWKSIF